MGIGDFLRRIAPAKGGERRHDERAEQAEAASSASIEYNGYRIRALPRRAGSQWHVAGSVSKESPQGERTYRFFRADTFGAREDAVSITIVKAKQMIDTEGDRIFDKRSDEF